MEEAPQGRALQEVLEDKETGHHCSYKGENKLLAVGAWTLTQQENLGSEICNQTHSLT